MKAATRRLLALLLAPLLVVTVAGLVLLWPSGGGVGLRAAGPTEDATVIGMREVACADTAPEAGIRCTRTALRLAGGGTGVLAEQPVGTTALRRGARVVVTRTSDASGTAYELTGRQRRRPLSYAVVATALAVLAVARWRGARLLLALAAAVLVLTVFAVPSMLDGHAPLLVALTAAAVVATIALGLGHGVNARSATALGGALLGIGAAGLAGKFVVDAAHFAGMASTDAAVLHVTSGAIPASGLLLGGLVLGAVGGVVDLAVGVVDATWDLRDAHPDAGARGIAVAGIRRGRQRLADVAATVSLAYAGVALPLLVLLSAGDQRVVDALGGDALGAEMTRALGGLVALTATLPLTAAIAAVVVVRERDGAAPVGDPRQFRSRRERRLFQDEG